jgi:hypothetical protein
MASSSMFDKAMRWARSPQGQRAIAKAQQAAKDPATRAKVQQLRGRAEQLARDPATRAKVERLRERLTHRDGDGTRPPATDAKPPATGPEPPTTGGPAPKP